VREARRNEKNQSRFARLRSRSLALFLLAVVLGVACQSEPDEAGGETHFLRSCSIDGGSCGGGLACLCGVCTVPCELQAQCSSFPAAQCTTPPTSSCGRLCAVACGRDEDCAVLSTEHRCLGGLCRAGSDEGENGGEGGEGPGPATGGQPAGSGGSSACNTPDAAANEVVILGDSFFAANHQVTAYLEDQGRSEGILSPGERYRDYSRVTQNSLALGGKGILAQYSAAAEEAPVTVAIMNGGGADILIGICETTDAECPVLTAAASAFSEVLTAMSDDGVSHVVFVGYPDPTPPAARAKLDVLRPMLEEACAASAAPCLWVDLRPDFAGHYAEYVQPDGLNPTPAGAEVAARAIARAMSEACIPR
jgi:hypothetical protein